MTRRQPTTRSYRYRHLVAIALALPALDACTVGVGGAPRADAPFTGRCLFGRAAPDVDTVSFASLSLQGARYHGKRVRVNGFLVFEFERTALYESRRAFQLGTMANLWLHTAPVNNVADACSHRYMIVEGVFDKDDQGVGISIASLSDVNLIEAEQHP